MDPFALILLAISFWGSVGGLMGARWEWTIIQTVLWPVTLVVRAITGDPLQNEATTPKKHRPNYDKIYELERVNGMPDIITFREMAGLRVGLSEAIRERKAAEAIRVQRQMDNEAAEIRRIATGLALQLPTESLHKRCRKVYELLDHDIPNLRLAWEEVRHMQVWVGLHGPEGIESYDSEMDLYDRYDELRIHLFRVEHGEGNSLMINNARDRLIRWCARHHNPRFGRIFLDPNHPDYTPYPESRQP